MKLSAVDINLYSVSIGPLPIYVICHHGNDSQKAVQVLQKHFPLADNSIIIRDIISGLSGWSRLVDPTFPEY